MRRGDLLVVVTLPVRSERAVQRGGVVTGEAGQPVIQRDLRVVEHSNVQRVRRWRSRRCLRDGGATSIALQVGILETELLFAHVSLSLGWCGEQKRSDERGCECCKQMSH